MIIKHAVMTNPMPDSIIAQLKAIWREEMVYQAKQQELGRAKEDKAKNNAKRRSKRREEK